MRKVEDKLDLPAGLSFHWRPSKSPISIVLIVLNKIRLKNGSSGDSISRTGSSDSVFSSKQTQIKKDWSEVAITYETKVVKIQTVKK
jgi:hypothetical protein